MKRQNLNRRLALSAVAAVAAVAAPTAQAAGGAVGHRYAPPPLDAGSALPNPVYVKSLPADSTQSDGFDWTAGAAGAGTAFVVIVGAAGAVAVTKRDRSRAAAG